WPAPALLVLLVLLATALLATAFLGAALLATARSTVLTSSGVSCGCLRSSRATSPVTCGAAKELPVVTIVDPDNQGTRTSMPGAPKSVGGAGWASMPNGSCPSWAATETTEESWAG